MSRFTIHDFLWLMLYSLRVLLLVVACGWLALIGLVACWIAFAAVWEGLPSNGNFPGGILTWYLSLVVAMTMPWAAGAYLIAAALSRHVILKKPKSS